METINSTTTSKIVFVVVDTGNIYCYNCGKVIAKRDSDGISIKCHHSDNGHKCGAINKIYIK